jgi:DNA-binding NtrC family response regulator
MAASILVVDDEKNAREGLDQALTGTFGKDSLFVETASDGLEAIRKMSDSAFDLVIADIKMPNMDGMELLKRIRENQPATQVVMLTGHGAVETAVEAMRLGATDYLQKPVNLDELELVVRRILDERKLLSENEYLRAKLREGGGFRELVGASQAMKSLFERIEQIAATKATVLITGESGTGKELVAEALHYLSPRQDQPLIKVNCSALNENLLESELFGHERGAFTGAVRQRKGRFELADKGTLFLDEIGELSPDIQVKLLRILEEKEFERVGGNRTIRVDTRLLFATNADLEKKVRDGKFREDFYFRLKVITLHIAPLRERREDIRPLCDFFIRQFSQENGLPPITLAADAESVMENYDWPGNVRELRNLIEHLVLLKNGKEIAIEDLREHLHVDSPEEGILIPVGATLADVEKKYILGTLEAHKGNRTHAAKALDIGRRTLIRKLNEYGVIGGEEDS